MMELLVRPLVCLRHFLSRLYFSWYELSFKFKPYSSKLGFSKTVSEPLTHNRATFKISKDSIVRSRELTIGCGCPFFSHFLAANTLMKSFVSLSDPPFVQNNNKKNLAGKNNLRKSRFCRWNKPDTLHTQYN